MRLNGAGASSDMCRIIGQVVDPERFLSALDVLLLPSVTEGIPGVLLEAALVGVPTVATDVGGVADTMRTVDAGRCVAADDLSGFVTAVRSVLTTATPTFLTARQSFRGTAWPRSPPNGKPSSRG